MENTDVIWPEVVTEPQADIIYTETVIASFEEQVTGKFERAKIFGFWPAAVTVRTWTADIDRLY